MLYLIHGDHIEVSHNKLMELKNDAVGKEIREINGKRFELTALVQALESSSLFGGDVCVVIDGFISNAKKREKTFASTLERIMEASKTIDVILFEEKEVEKTTLTKLGTAVRIFFHKMPVIIFQFLDSVRPGNAKASLLYFSEVTRHEPSEIVFSLLVRRVRQLLQLADHVMPDGLQSWQADRLTSQARHFTIEQLIAMHTRLLETDIAIKTGSSPFTLAQHIQQILISL